MFFGKAKESPIIDLLRYQRVLMIYQASGQAVPSFVEYMLL